MSEKIVAFAKWMVGKIIDLLRENSTINPDLLRNELAKYGVFPTDMQLYRAKQKAQTLLMVTMVIVITCCLSIVS